MIGCAMFVRTIGIRIMVGVAVLVVNVDLVNEPEELKRRVRRGWKPQSHHEHRHQCLQPCHVTMNKESGTTRNRFLFEITWSIDGQ